MKKFWDKLSQYLKIAFLTTLVGGVTFIVLLVLSLLNLFSYLIPLGVIIGTLLLSVSYLLLDRIGYIEDDNQKVRLTMIISTTRLFLLVGLAILEVLLEKKLEFSLFNPFAFIGAYLVCSAISIIIMQVEKKKC